MKGVGSDGVLGETVDVGFKSEPNLIYGVLKNQLPFDPNYGKQFVFNP